MLFQLLFLHTFVIPVLSFRFVCYFDPNSLWRGEPMRYHHHDLPVEKCTHVIVDLLVTYNEETGKIDTYMPDQYRYLDMSIFLGVTTLKERNR